MSNQRAGKTYRAAASDGLEDMNLRNFFRTSAELLTESGNEDAAFYFEQIVDELNKGKSLPKEKREISRILGI